MQASGAVFFHIISVCLQYSAFPHNPGPIYARSTSVQIFALPPTCQYHPEGKGPRLVLHTLSVVELGSYTVVLESLKVGGGGGTVNTGYQKRG